MSDQLNEDVTASQEANNPANEGTQTDETAKDSASEAGNVEKKEESPYEAQLKELEARLKEKEDIIAKKDQAIKVKNRAINELKGNKATSEEGEAGEVDLADKILAKLEAKQAEKEFKNAVNTLTMDDAEKSLILKHYEHSIVPTGNVERDLKNALALANADLIYEQRAQQLRDEAREEELAGLSASIMGSAPRKSSYKDPVTRQAEAILELIDPKAKKFLAKG